MSFVSFLQEKKSSPLLFFLEEKTVSSRGKRRSSDGRTQAHPALSSVGIPHGYASLLRLVSARVRCACAPAFPCKPTTQKKIICGKAIILHCCLFRQRAMQNGRFVCEPSVFSLQAGCTGNRLSPERHPLPLCLLFLFFKKRKRPPFDKKKRKRPPFQKKRNRSLERSRSPQRVHAERDPPKNCLSRADMLYYKL